MSQNRSTAVMQQRHEPHDSLDFFPTPPWATRALVEHVLAGHGWRLDQLGGMTAWDPCCGALHMVRPMLEYFGQVHASDIHDYWQSESVPARRADFLMPGQIAYRDPEFLFFNPPFRLALDFIERARAIATQGVCVLVRTAFLEGGARYRALFKGAPPLIVAPFVERVIMAKGRCMDPAKLYWDFETKKWKKPSTATSYCWLVFPGRAFQRVDRHARLIWIPPCRKKLEQPGDYDNPVRPNDAPPPGATASGEHEAGGLI